MTSSRKTTIWELARCGLGISFAQSALVENTPGMRALLPGLQIPPLEIWLTNQRELFTSRRIRVIYDRLAELLGEYFQKPETMNMARGDR